MADLVIPPLPPTVEERVNYVVTLMASGQYISGQTCYDLARAWGQPQGTVNTYCAEASRRIRSELDSDEIRALVATSLQTIARDALTANDRKNAIRALEAIGRVIGTPRPSVTIQGLSGSGAQNIQIVMLPPEKPLNTLGSAQPTPELQAPMEPESGPANSLP